MGSVAHWPLANRLPVASTLALIIITLCARPCSARNGIVATNGVGSILERGRQLRNRQAVDTQREDAEWLVDFPFGRRRRSWSSMNWTENSSANGSDAEAGGSTTLPPDAEGEYPEGTIIGNGTEGNQTTSKCPEKLRKLLGSKLCPETPVGSNASNATNTTDEVLETDDAAEGDSESSALVIEDSEQAHTKKTKAHLKKTKAHTKKTKDSEDAEQGHPAHHKAKKTSLLAASDGVQKAAVMGSHNQMVDSLSRRVEKLLGRVL